MLEVGHGNFTLEENRSHFPLWAALKSPLIIGTKLNAIRPEVLIALKNEELIAFNQDPAGAMPYRCDGVGNETHHPVDYRARSSSQGVHAFLLNTEERDMELMLVEVLGLQQAMMILGPYLVHDMCTGEDTGIFSVSVVLWVQRHDTASTRITRADGQAKTHCLLSIYSTTLLI